MFFSVKRLSLPARLIFVIVVQSLQGMEESIPCSPIVNLRGIVPGVVAPIGIGCTENGIVISDKDAFNVWDMQKQKKFIGLTGGVHDFAVNRAGTKVAWSGGCCLAVYDAYSGEKEWHLIVQNSPIAFNHKDEVVVYQKTNNQWPLIICSKSSHRPIEWPDVSLQANDSFAHHPLKEQIVFGVASDTCYCGNYEQRNYTPFTLSFPDNFFAVGQLYNNDGSCVAIIGRSSWETSIQFAAIDPKAPSYMFPGQSTDIDLQKICVAMAFHPNNKLFFLLDENNIIDCFHFETKKCIHSMCCKGQAKIPVNGNGLEKRLAFSRDAETLYVALKDKVVAIAVDDRKQQFFMLCALMLYEHNNDLLPPDVVRIIMYNALKVSNAPLWSYLDKN